MPVSFSFGGKREGDAPDAVGATELVRAIGLTLAVFAAVSGAESHRAGLRRDEQAAAITSRLGRGEAELAEQHRKSVAVLSDYASVTQTLAYSFAGLAAAALALQVVRSRSNLAPRS